MQSAPLPSPDPSGCDREPIHLLGFIQPYGFLIAASTDGMIQHVSANIGAFLPVDATQLPGAPLADVLPEQALTSIRERLRVLTGDDGTERIFGCDLLGEGRAFDVSVHVCGPVAARSIVIEAEPSSTSDQPINPGALVRTLIGRMQKTQGLEPLFHDSVRQLRAFSGYDRVMLYRFSDSGSGTVVAEAAREGLKSYLGLHYPATDIPAQARALYVKNPTRGIADIRAAPVPVIPPLSPEGQPLDLSLSELRSVSPVHVEYLANMDVAASFSISVVIGGTLWGLFALHHGAARHLPMETRAAAELFGQMTGLLIEARLYAEQRRGEDAARDLHDRLIGKIVAASASIETIAQHAEDLSQIVPCDGLAVWSNGSLQSFGVTPSADDLPELVRMLNRAAPSRVYATDALGTVHPPALAFLDRAAGVLAIPISRSPRDYILFFRREALRTVTWAGDPSSKETVMGSHGPRLSPRQSFAAWQETISGTSPPWSEADRKAAEALRVSVLEVLLRFSEETDRQRLRASRRQELLIAELNHRVRNILGLMRALVAQSQPSAVSVDDFAKIIGGRIQALARAHDQITSESFSATSLRQIIETEVQAYVGGKASRVALSGPDIYIEAKAFSTLALVFHEMVTNSAKYGALMDGRGSVAVRWSIDDGGSCRIFWAEVGGPPVAMPARRGFGSTIIERSIPHDLEGMAEMRYCEAGLEADFVLPSSVFNLAPQERSPMPFAQIPALLVESEDRAPTFEGLHGLIVEDNMIIALDAEQLMLDNGMVRVHLAASVAEARKIIAGARIDFALLDINLGSETSFPLIAPLNEKGVPFVFCTGYGEGVELPEEAGNATALKKPFAGDRLIEAIGSALASRAAAQS